MLSSAVARRPPPRLVRDLREIEKRTHADAVLASVSCDLLLFARPFPRRGFFSATTIVGVLPAAAATPVDPLSCTRSNATRHTVLYRSYGTRARRIHHSHDLHALAHHAHYPPITVSARLSSYKTILKLPISTPSALPYNRSRAPTRRVTVRRASTVSKCAEFVPSDLNGRPP